MSSAFAAKILAAFDAIRALYRNASPAERLNPALLTDRALDNVLAATRWELRKQVQQSHDYAQRTFPPAVQRKLKEAGVTIGVSFDYLNPRVIDAIRALDSAVIDRLKTDIRDTVKQTIEGALLEGLNPRAVAGELQDVIGLAPNQLDAVNNFRRALQGDPNAGNPLARQLRDRRYDRTVEQGDLSPEQIDAMTEAYRGRMIAFNAETNARTAALQALKEGQLLAWQDAMAQGVIDERLLTKRWSGVLDNRERDEHLDMEGETVGINDAYTNGEMVPGDSTFNCRCISIISAEETEQAVQDKRDQAYDRAQDRTNRALAGGKGAAGIYADAVAKTKSPAPARRTKRTPVKRVPPPTDKGLTAAQQRSKDIVDAMMKAANEGVGFDEAAKQVAAMLTGKSVEELTAADIEAARVAMQGEMANMVTAMTGAAAPPPLGPHGEKPIFNQATGQVVYYDPHAPLVTIDAEGVHLKGFPDDMISPTGLPPEIVEHANREIVAFNTAHRTTTGLNAGEKGYTTLGEWEPGATQRYREWGKEAFEKLPEKMRLNLQNSDFGYVVEPQFPGARGLFDPADSLMHINNSRGGAAATKWVAPSKQSIMEVFVHEGGHAFDRLVARYEDTELPPALRTKPQPIQNGLWTDVYEPFRKAFAEEVQQDTFDLVNKWMAEGHVLEIDQGTFMLKNHDKLPGWTPELDTRFFFLGVVMGNSYPQFMWPSELFADIFSTLMGVAPEDRKFSMTGARNLVKAFPKTSASIKALIDRLTKNGKL